MLKLAICYNGSIRETVTFSCLEPHPNSHPATRPHHRENARGLTRALSRWGDRGRIVRSAQPSGVDAVDCAEVVEVGGEGEVEVEREWDGANVFFEVRGGLSVGF